MESWPTKMDGICLRLDSAMGTLTERIAELHIAETNLDTKMAELADSQARIRQRFNALKHIVKAKRNGKGSA
jgi:prefoldin subunit 5